MIRRLVAPPTLRSTLFSAQQGTTVTVMRLMSFFKKSSKDVAAAKKGREAVVTHQARGKKISEVKQKELFPGLIRTREVKRFEGEHTFSHPKNSGTLLWEGKTLVIVPLTFALMAWVQYSGRDLPWWFDTWTFTIGFTAFAFGAGRFFAMGRRNRVIANLTGQHVVITGATSGVGLEAACQFASMGASVTVLSRESKHSSQAIERIRKNAVEGASVHFTAVEFTDLVSVRDAARRLRNKGKPVDILVNNAAVMKGTQVVTKYGDDEMLAVNLLAPYIITEGLLPLVEMVKGRIVHVSCSAHVGVRTYAVQRYLTGKGMWNDKMSKFDGLEQFGFTKLGLIYHAQQLAMRSYPVAAKISSRASRAKVATGEVVEEPTAQEPKFTVCACNPSGVLSGLYRHVPLAFLLNYVHYLLLVLLKSPYDGSQTVVNAAVRSDIVNGGYYLDCRYVPNALSSVACNVKERDGVMEWLQKKMEPYMKWN